MTYRVFLESTVKPESYQHVFKFLEENLPNVRSFRGCLNVTVLYDEENNRLVFDEEWLSIEHHQKYVAFITSNGVLEALIDYLEGEPKVTYYQKQLI
ncbi:MAG: putative quinol monooxygenase [Arenicella sp.]